jgi:monoamine oxidase
VSFFHLRDGLEQVPITIAARFQDAGGRIFLEQRLKSFDQTILPDGSAGVELHVASGDQSVRIVRARKLILAMPRRSLELLDQTGAVLGPENGRVHELIRSVQPIPLFKLALCYSYPWWETVDAVQVQGPGGTTLANITRGRSVTDLPLRQCYYWAKDERSQKAVVLIYDDGADLDFWAGLRDLGSNEPFEPDVKAMAADTPLPESWSAHRAPRLMVEEAHRQMLIVHGARNRTDVPMPYAAAYRDWGENPFGGGANFWRVNVRSDEVFQDILQPKPPVPVYVCGEAYSHHQGWAEGPLATADAMLERHFGVGPPGWLKL